MSDTVQGTACMFACDYYFFLTLLNIGKWSSSHNTHILITSSDFHTLLLLKFLSLNMMRYWLPLAEPVSLWNDRAPIQEPLFLISNTSQPK